MNKKQQELVAEYKLVKNKTTDTYTAREFAGLALECNVFSLTPGPTSTDTYIEADKILRDAAIE